MSDPAIIKLTRKNLLLFAEKSVGCNLFRNAYVVKPPSTEEIDVLEDGDLSCAIFVSTLLVMVGLIQRPHFVVGSVLKDMEASGWQPIDAPRPGAVVTWSGNGAHHPHIGIVIDETTCINNSSTHRTPQRTALTMSDGREPDGFYWHSKLEDSTAVH